MSINGQHATVTDPAPMLQELDRKMTKTDGKSQNYKGFVAGVFSGIAKLSGKLQIPLFLTARTNFTAKLCIPIA